MHEHRQAPGDRSIDDLAGDRGTRAHGPREVAEPRASGYADEPGKVFLVGAGPGDPDLLTLRGLRALERAEVLLFDRLVDPRIVALAPAAARRMFVGKERGHHSLPQEEINAALVQAALEGRTVVRLKGGDPYVFGRGGEEVEALVEHGIAFEVIPGVTAACGVAAYAGIPLTHRDFAQACVFVTGHLRDGTVDLDWSALARPRQTVVIYMGLQALPIVCERLVAHGLSPATPAAVVQNGTTVEQRVIAGTLATLPERAARAALGPPTLTIVGRVVELRDRLRWFDPAAQGSEWSSDRGRGRAAAGLAASNVSTARREET